MIVDGDRSARQNTSTNVDGGEISVDQKGDASVASNKDHLAVADNKSKSDVSDELKEISLNEKEVGTQTSIKETTGIVSSQSKGEKKKKKKASKGTEIALDNAKGEEVPSMALNPLPVGNEGTSAESDVVNLEELKEGPVIEDMALKKSSTLGD